MPGKEIIGRCSLCGEAVRRRGPSFKAICLGCGATEKTKDLPVIEMEDPTKPIRPVVDA